MSVIEDIANGLADILRRSPWHDLELVVFASPKVWAELQEWRGQTSAWHETSSEPNVFRVFMLGQELPIRVSPLLAGNDWYILPKAMRDGVLRMEALTRLEEARRRTIALSAVRDPLTDPQSIEQRTHTTED